MLQLIKELLKREWCFTVTNNEDSDAYHLELVLGNQLLRVYDNTDAKNALKEIREHW